MIDMIGGYLFTAGMICALLYPMYIALFYLTKWYISSISSGKWKIKSPIWDVVSEYEWGSIYTGINEVVFVISYLFIGGFFMISLFGIIRGEITTPKNFLANIYILGTSLTTPILVVATLWAIHAVAKRLFTLGDKYAKALDKLDK